jgi:hypothetical protein
VACNQREDGESAIILKLARREFDEVFGRLCQDLVDATRDTAPQLGAEALFRRLTRWRKLLEVGQRTTLSDTALRGLLGELWFLQYIAIPRLGIEAGVRGWVGPLDAPQDFLVNEFLFEIKTCVPGANRVTITSLQQLDTGNSPLYLGVVWLASANPTVHNAFCAAHFVASIRNAIEANPTSSTEFALRLAEAGYTDCEEYEHAWYNVTQTRCFHVRDDFPRLIRGRSPVGVEDATYVIDLSACESFECQF